jgi:hypothetical protein
MTIRRLSPALALRLTVNAEPWLSCDDCFDLVDEYIEHLLADPNYDHQAMSAHLRGCGACAEEATSLLELSAREAGIDPQQLLARLGS